MALSNPRGVFGVHSWTPYNRTTGEFYGTALVLASSSLNLSGELIELVGGSQRYSWAVEDGAITAELSLNFREYPDFLFELFLGKAVTSNAAEASGNCSTLTNKSGTSLVDASTGVATATVKSGSEADLKFGKFVVKVVTATTVDVFASSNIDFNRGTDKEFENDLLKITASPLTITASTAVEIPGYGVELTGGSGTIGMTAGDTATFEVRPINTESTTVSIGGGSDTFPEFGSIVYAQQRSNGEMFEIDLVRCKAIGMPIGFSEKAWAEGEVTVKAFYDSTLNKVADIRHVAAS